SPVAYYQQIGRAGRGVERADVIALPGREDADIWAYFASLAFPPEAVVAATLAALGRAGRPLSTAALETRVDLTRSRLEMMLKVLDVDGAVRRVSGGWTATGQPWAYDGDRYARVAGEREREQQAMLGYLETAGCRMEYLRRELDDPAARPCGRCDNCTGQPWPAPVSAAGAAVAGERLLRPGVVVAPRLMWPPGMSELGVPLAGRIAAASQAGPGRAVAAVTGLGWGPRLRELLAEPDGPVPADLVAAVVAVLAGWDWADRPAAVVTLPSRTRPGLIASLGEQIAAIGRLRYAGSLAYADAGDGAGQSSAGQRNSAQRLRAVWSTLRLPGPVVAALSGAPGPVLLVDDRIATGWTVTVAASLLRDAGAPAVLPFVLALGG
ncbi:MAG: RecQ family zinc-binding domain-containing protein, partial [Streptosporangiaceae bacterium]